MKQKWIAIVFGVVAVVLVVFLLLPAGQFMTGSKTVASSAPDFSSTVKASDGRVVLPAVAGKPAAIYFTLTNTGKNTINITQVTMEHATTVGMTDNDTPNAAPISTLPVPPNETLSFSPSSRYRIAAVYDGSIVPGAKVNLNVTFGTSGSLTIPAVVEPGTGQNGSPGPAQPKR